MIKQFLQNKEIVEQTFLLFTILTFLTKEQYIIFKKSYLFNYSFLLILGLYTFVNQLPKPGLEIMISEDEIISEFDVTDQDYIEEGVFHVLYTLPSNLKAVMEILKHHSFFKGVILTDLIVTDRPGKVRRFLIIYLLSAPNLNTKFYLKIQGSELTPISSIHTLFSSSLWSEREIWDLYGINIIHHPDLRRILTDYGFSGHPLRKDFPLTGFYELTYFDYSKLIEKTRVELIQQYRVFTFSEEWRYAILPPEPINVQHSDEE